MKSRFKSNDFFAILIAIALIAIGFVLLFIHQQSSSSEKHAVNMSDRVVTDQSLSDARLIQASNGTLGVEAQSKSEFQLIRES